MRVETINYVDYDGNERTDTYYFHLKRKDLTKLNFMFKGGFEEYFKKLVENDDNEKIIELFETIIRMAVGERTDDGKGFHKSAEYAEEFMESAAYDSLYAKILGDVDYLNDFIKSIIPPELLAEAVKRNNALSAELGAETSAVVEKK